MWIGCDFFGWMRLLIRNRLDVEWPYAYIALIDTVASMVNTSLRYVEEAWYGRRLAAVEVKPPIFILGHWRTGTTLLHEILSLDPAHTAPTTYECFSPNHFLLTEKRFTRWLGFLVPQRRPMDNMAFGWNRPQEDEFALCNLGVPSPYLSIAFPKRPPQYPEYADLAAVSLKERQRWKQALLRFLQKITLLRPRRIVLKSPLHTCRVPVLLELFPEARFVHLVRNPYAVYASTLGLWKALSASQGLQRPTYAGLEESVLGTFRRMHDRLEATRHLVDPSRFYELRYEDLIRDPRGEIRGLYSHLGLDTFEALKPALDSYLSEVADYRPNRHRLAAAERAEVDRRWAPYFEKHGYAQSRDLAQVG